MHQVFTQLHLPRELQWDNYYFTDPEQDNNDTIIKQQEWLLLTSRPHRCSAAYLEVCGALSVCCCVAGLAEGQWRPYLGSYCSVPLLPLSPHSRHTENTWGSAGWICHPLSPRHPPCTHTSGRWLWQRTLRGKPGGSMSAIKFVHKYWRSQLYMNVHCKSKENQFLYKDKGTETN